MEVKLAQTEQLELEKVKMEAKNKELIAAHQDSIARVQKLRTISHNWKNKYQNTASDLKVKWVFGCLLPCRNVKLFTLTTVLDQSSRALSFTKSISCLIID